ncbi:MAG: hypothetical protein IJS46_03830, partial [Kiritimatiellae bacterium]|nr:hypothetical protein [Kiritimatiellia bacterium]
GKAVEKLREAAFGRNGGGSAAERALALLPAACHAAGLDEEALVHYDDFTNRYAASRFMPDVKFWRASMEFDGGEWLRASDLLLSFAADCPESPKTPYAEYLAAVALVRSGRESQAAAVLDGVVSKWPDCAIVPDALLLEAESLASIMRFDAAAAVFDRASAANASRPQIALRAALRRADCLFATSGDFPAGRDESMAIYRRIASDAAAAQSAGLVAECRWKIGRALEKAGKTEDALDEWFGGCIAPFERSADPAAAPWYSRAVFSSAAILAASGRREAAAALLSHLASSPGVPGGEEAARRLEAL